MLKLYQFSPRWNIPNTSPFCLKLETYLRMAQIPYTNKYVNDPRKSPKGKLPYILDDGKKIADSNLIIDYLQLKHNSP
jgi:glutathione S-transferase